MLFKMLLILHVALAGIALAAGAVALTARKGGSAHRRSGLIFVAGMLSMTAIALVIALMRNAEISIVPSMLSFYLVATGWLTLAPGARRTRVEIALTALALAAAATGFTLGAIHSAGEGKGASSVTFLAFGAIALLGAGLDGWRRLKPLASRGARLGRHLWRMGLAMLIATLSFFQGQPQVFPAGLRGSWLLLAPALAVVAVLVVWAVRLLLRKGPRPIAPRQAPAPA